MSDQEQPVFRLGFAELARLLGPDIVGTPLENEHHDSPNGDGLQATTNGLLVWRKADNWTAFTDGYRTWVTGPDGQVHERLNTERWSWEADYVPPASGYAPRVLQMPLAAISNRFPYLTVPRGFLLHGTRSGVSRPVADEFPGAAQYEMTRTDGLGAVCTVGDDVVAQHLPWDHWCWHARGCSRYYVGCEFAQGTADDPITDAQVRAFCWVVQQVRAVFPTVPLAFPTHAEVDGTALYGGWFDGKSDVFPKGDQRADELRSRIMAKLAQLGVR
ncbi:MAG: N-acetylmuramoyl-L-alanine amidase [Sphingomonadaceae bacterium]